MFRQVTAALSGEVRTQMPSTATFELDPLDPGLFTERGLVLVDRPRRIGDVGLAVAEQREAVAGARAVDR